MSGAVLESDFAADGKEISEKEVSGSEEAAVDMSEFVDSHTECNDPDDFTDGTENKG